MSTATKEAYYLPRSEWDFSKIPLGEMEACFAWEYAREWENIDYVDLPRETINIGPGKEDEIGAGEIENPDYAAYLQNPDEVVGCLRGDMVVENSYLLGTSWQDLKKEKRAELVSLGTPDAIGILELQPKTSNFNSGFGLLEDSTATPCFAAAAFRINWNQSDKRLVSDFSDWLKANRKKPARESRGRNRRDSLNMLAAMRLLHRMPLEEAIIHTTRLLGEPLYGKRPSWERARKAALEIFRNEFLVHPQDDDLPKSYEKYAKPPEDDFDF
jgi:hypothetical protein